MATVNEMIKKFELGIAYKNGEKGVAIKKGKPNEEEMLELKANKTEILAELTRKEEEVNAFYEARKQADAAEKIAKMNAIKNNEKPFKLTIKDGEYLRGYTAYGVEAELLEQLKVARYIDGWGTSVNNEVLETLGNEFYYSDLLAYATPIIEAKAEAIVVKKEIEEKRVAEIFKKAKETGEKQVLRKITVECNDPYEECNLDLIVTWAMPNGMTTENRNHTW